MKEINDTIKTSIGGIQGIISGYIKDNRDYSCILDIAEKSGLINYIPSQLRQWGDSDFNYDVDVWNFLIEIYVDEDIKTLENFFQNLIDNI